MRGATFHERDKLMRQAGWDFCHDQIDELAYRRLIMEHQENPMEVVAAWVERQSWLVRAALAVQRWWGW